MRAGGLVGREDERAALRLLLDRARQGRGGIGVIEGEAGIGKSMLLRAVLDEAATAGFAVFAGKAEELTRDLPFATLSRVLDLRQSSLSGRRADVAFWLRNSAGPDEVGEDFAQLEFRVVEATVALVDETSTATPLVVAVDDLQWADAATLRALARVAAIVPELPAVLICSARPGPTTTGTSAFRALLHDYGAEMLRLGPLAAGDVPVLVERLVGGTPGPTLLARLDTAGGNPLFLSVALDALRAAGELVDNDGTFEVTESASPTLSKTIMDRLRLCARETLDALSVAAILGTEFTAADLSTLHGSPVPALLPAIRDGLEASILEERGDRLAFRHDLIREALYVELPLTVRQSMHIEAAKRLAAAGAPVTLTAQHLLHGAGRADADLLDLLHRTAVEARRAAPDIALALLDRVVDLAGDGSARADATLGDRALILFQLGDIPLAEAACRAALAKGVSASEPANVRLRLVQSLASRGDASNGLPEVALALADPTTTVEDAAKLEAHVTALHLFSGDFEAGIAAAEHAVALAERTTSDATKLAAYNAIGMVRRAVGRFDDAYASASRATQLLETGLEYDAVRMVPYLMLARALVDRGYVAEALEGCRRGLHMSEDLADPDSVTWHHLAIANCLVLLGDWEGADTEYELVREFHGDSFGIPTSLLGFELAMVAVWRNDLVNARAHIATAERAEAELGAQVYPGMSVRAQALVLEADGQLEAAADLLEGAWELLASVGALGELPDLAWDAVRVAAALDRAPKVDVVASLEELAAANPGAPRLAALALACRGVRDRDADALAAAAEAFGQTDMRFDTALVAEAAGAALLRDGRRDEAINLLERALSTYVAVGATRLAAQVGALLRSAGVASGRRGARSRPKTGWEALTETERTVAHLVAERLSNPEIAERLFISRRTVQTHVSHALAKLGVSSRRQLADAAAEHEGWTLTLS